MRAVPIIAGAVVVLTVLSITVSVNFVIRQS